MMRSPKDTMIKCKERSIKRWKSVKIM